MQIQARIPEEFRKFSVTDRVPLNLVRHASLLRCSNGTGVPFVLDESTLVTIDDFDVGADSATMKSPTEIIELPNFCFTRNAFNSCMSDLKGDALTKNLENLGDRIDLDNEKKVREFSKMVVVDWGRGGRVWGNLKRHHGDKLGALLAQWLKGVRSIDDPKEAINGGCKIKGLGVSFASKHLRMLDKERFATLDEVLSFFLGYALNPAGYNLWIHALGELNREHKLAKHRAHVEVGIFLLVRQLRRSKIAE